MLALFSSLVGSSLIDKWSFSISTCESNCFSSQLVPLLGDISPLALTLVKAFDDCGGGVWISMAESILMLDSNPELVEQWRERFDLRRIKENIREIAVDQEHEREV